MIRTPLAFAAALSCACGESAGPVSSGGTATVVGVLPYATSAIYCEQGTNRESAYFRMDDENDTHCSYETGDLESSFWAPPGAAKVPLPEECGPRRTHTLLQFCRTSVPAGTFRPLTTDPDAHAQAYALLRFGDSCPPHSVEISKRIINEDADNENDPIEAADLLAPNQIVDDARGNYTKLYFCLFRAAPSVADTMDEFPDLGFPYAVFHDFDGDQPGWVIRKRWQYSDDSNQARPVNQYVPSADVSEDSAVLQLMIENPERDGDFDTYFEFARVR